MKALLLIAFVVCAGCAFIRHTDLSITNAEYKGPYCPTGCKADVHYMANTQMELGCK